jgi:tRNA acetyltransferase TAN1
MHSQYAIRPTFRNHNTLKRDFVIHAIAGLINDKRHRVNLEAPDKVILVDIYQVRSQTASGCHRGAVMYGA